MPVIDKERSGKTQQRLDWHERDLPAPGYRSACPQRLELFPRLTDRQIQVIGKISHGARLLSTHPAAQAVVTIDRYHHSL